MQIKTLNKSTNKYGFRGGQDNIFPPMVFAEITNVCNLKCIHCPYSQISQQKFYKPRHMNLGIYKKIVDEACEFEGVIFRLVCDGEPMMHPNFLDMVAYAKQKMIRPLCFNTNATLLDEYVSREILRYGVDVVEISLDAINKTTYDRIRNGADYSKVMLNVHRFIKMRSDLNSNTKIMVSIIDQPEAESEIGEFIAYWSAKVDRVITRTYTSIGGLVGTRKIKVGIGQDRWPCPLLWTRIFINVDGLIKFCVEDWLDKTVVGDIRYESIRHVWGSHKYRELRKCHMYGRFDEIPYCQNCLDWPARNWDYDYFYALDKVLETKPNL